MVAGLTLEYTAVTEHVHMFTMMSSTLHTTLIPARGFSEVCVACFVPQMRLIWSRLVTMETASD